MIRRVKGLFRVNNKCALVLLSLLCCAPGVVKSQNRVTGPFQVSQRTRLILTTLNSSPKALDRRGYF